MRVYMCDRCGKYVGWDDRYALRLQVYIEDGERLLYRKKHLCAECNQVLCEWLSDPKAKEEGE